MNSARTGTVLKQVCSVLNSGHERGFEFRRALLGITPRTSHILPLNLGPGPKTVACLHVSHGWPHCFLSQGSSELCPTKYAYKCPTLDPESWANASSGDGGSDINHKGHGPVSESCQSRKF